MTIGNTDYHKVKRMSTSLTSLQPNSQSLERQRHVRKMSERLYNSLTKKRKDPKQINAQRMWINYEDCKNDFWAAIRSNYDYIMDTNLIETCKEANGELTWDETDVSTQSWNLKEFSNQFSELYSWLRVLQELVYSKEENLLDKSLRAAHLEELRRKAYRRKLFNEQAEKLISRAPALKDEVVWRVDHLNTKWELVEQIMAPIDQPVSSQQDISADFKREVKCLRKWLREMESRLQPLNFHINWTLSELEEKTVEHMVFQQDIKAHGCIVNSVVKLGDKVSKHQQQQQQQQQQEQGQQREKRKKSSQPLRIVRLLEERWLRLLLHALEWQCHIEALVSRVRNKNAVSTAGSNSDSDEEPVTKQPRLSRGRSRGSGAESPGQSARSARTERAKRVAGRSRSEYHRHPISNERTDQSDSDAFSENQSISEGSYFEDELYQLYVMDARSDKPAKRETTGSITSIARDRGEEGDVEESRASDNEQRDMPPTPDTVPITTSTAVMQETCDEIDAASTVQIESTEKSNNGLRTSELVKRGATDEIASFNMSDRKSKNCATFYFKHLDTDSEADCSQLVQESSNTVDDSSEEEWTYTPARQNSSTLVVSEQQRTNVVVRLDFGESPRIDISEKMHFAQKKSPNNEKEIERNDCQVQQKDSDDEKKNDKSSIEKLIKEVENLVGEERHTTSRTYPQLEYEEKNITNTHRVKYARVKEWLKSNASRSYEGRSQPLDSCDASGEYTTEESDEERQSISSDDLQSSVATYRRFEGALACTSQSLSQEILDCVQKTPVNEIPPEENTPKVIMRSKQKAKGSRPWSVSCISQIGDNPSLAQKNNLPFSISESALHQLVATPPTKSVSFDASGSRKSFNNSATTLLEESFICSDDRVARNISFRRKKNRLRKKTLGRKSESSSESTHANHHSAGSDGSSNQQRSSRKINLNRTTHIVTKENCHSRSTTLVKSGSFSGCTVHQQLHVERTFVNNPIPLLCCKSVASTEGEDRDCVQGHFAYNNDMLNSKELSNQQLNVDSDVEMNSLGNNSLYEQAWDNYVEKYMSEPYSEPLDVETARRLLDFGDDYRNFLDSQSECASSISAIPARSPLPKTRTYHEIDDSTEDSDNDEEEARKIIENSQTQFMLAEDIFVRSNGAVPTQLDEVESACKENLRCLQTVLESQKGYLRNEKYLKQIRDLIGRWETLASRVEQTKKASVLRLELAVLRTEFKTKYDRFFDYEIGLEQSNVFDDHINEITTELTVLERKKTEMLKLNVSVHRLITDLGASAPLICTALKDDVDDLYRIWNETFQKGTQQLCVLQAMQQFDMCWAELQFVLQRDKDTLAEAQQAGSISTVRHVARLLCEKKKDINCQNDSVLNDATTEEVHCGKFAGNPVSSQEGGSFSDSGISDSGSDQELSERERRLAALRRLTRSLETQLAPNSEVLTDLWKRIECAETELRDLQNQCEELIMNTANRTVSQVHCLADKCKKAICGTDTSKSFAEMVSTTSSNAKGNNPDKPNSRGWIGIVKKAFCFAMTSVLFIAGFVVYISCFFGQCCESTNALNSFALLIRYPRGPPPV